MTVMQRRCTVVIVAACGSMLAEVCDSQHEHARCAVFVHNSNGTAVA
jgi:hypothetical protein